jgi:LacI family transcriptional regulator
MADGTDSRRPRVLDIALLAGVSTATVDRVLNGRPGVKRSTVDRVQAAVETLAASEARPQVTLTTEMPQRVGVVISKFGGFANEVLTQAFRELSEELGLALDLVAPEAMTPAAYGAALEQCAARGCAGVVLQALDHRSVRDAVARLAAEGVPVVTILTSLPGSAAIGYAGLDNRSAGRTAGLLMGRLCRRAGEVAVFTGGALYRSHEEREIGIRTVIREEFPDLTILEASVGQDDPWKNHAKALELMRTRPDLVGLINVGSGNRGIEKAVIERDRSADLIYVAFNLTPLTREALMRGTIDAVVHQDMAVSARTALSALIEAHAGRATAFPPTHLEIVMRENIR